MTTINTQPGTAKRRRLTNAGTLLTAAAVIALSALGPVATAHADTTAPPPPPASPSAPDFKIPPGGGVRGPWLAIAWSPDNGDHGWANERATVFEARDSAVANCQHFGGDQCQVVVETRECGALFAAPPDAGRGWGPANTGTGATPDAAQAAATDPSKLYDTGIPLIIRCATGDAGQG